MHPVGAGADGKAGVAVLVPGAKGEELGAAAAQGGGIEQIADSGPFADGLQQGLGDGSAGSTAPCGMARSRAQPWMRRRPGRHRAAGRAHR